MLPRRGCRGGARVGLGALAAGGARREGRSDRAGHTAGPSGQGNAGDAAERLANSRHCGVSARARRGRATFGKRAQRISSREVTYRKRRGWKSIFQWRGRLQQMSFCLWRFGGQLGEITPPVTRRRVGFLRTEK